MYGTDLGDLYRDAMSLRQVWVRVKALPPESPVHRTLRDEAERAKEKRRSDELDEAVNRFRKG